MATVLTRQAVNASVAAGDSFTDFAATPRSTATDTKPGLGHSWATGLSRRIYFSPSADRTADQERLLSGFALDEGVLSIVREDGEMFTVVECVVERHVGRKLRTKSMFLGHYDIIA